jgi:hypothetical protein
MPAQALLLGRHRVLFPGTGLFFPGTGHSLKVAAVCFRNYFF